MHFGNPTSHMIDGLPGGLVRDTCRRISTQGRHYAVNIENFVICHILELKDPQGHLNPQLFVRAIYILPPTFYSIYENQLLFQQSLKNPYDFIKC